MTEALSNDIKKKFVWAEISYLDLWWNEQGSGMREKFKKQVTSICCMHVVSSNTVRTH